MVARWISINFPTRIKPSVIQAFDSASRACHHNEPTLLMLAAGCFSRGAALFSEV